MTARDTSWRQSSPIRQLQAIGVRVVRNVTDVSIKMALLPTLMTLGLVARLWNADSMALWVDEAISARAAEAILLRGVPAVRRFGGGTYLYDRSLLYSYLVSASFKLFDISTVSARLPGIFFGVLLIPVTYLLATYTVNQRVGFYAAALTTFHPWLIATSRYTRFYAVFQTLFVLALVGYIGWLRETESSRKQRMLVPHEIARQSSDRKRYVFLGILAIALLSAYFTHRFYLLIVGILGVYTSIYILTGGRLAAVGIRRVTAGALSMTTLVGLGVVFDLLPKKLRLLVAPESYAGIQTQWLAEYLLSNSPWLVGLAVLGVMVLVARSVVSPSQGYGDFLVSACVITFGALSLGVPITTGQPEPRYLSSMLPLLLITAAVAIDAGIRFFSRHPDVRSVLGKEPRSDRSVIATLTPFVVVVLLLLVSFTAALPHFAENGYEADFGYADRVQESDLRGPSEFVRGHADEDVTVYIYPLNTPTFYLNWERGDVGTIRYLDYEGSNLVERWGDEQYIIRDLSELQQAVKADAKDGDVWFVVKNWKQEDRASWVQERSTRVDGDWHGAELYKFRGDEIEAIPPASMAWSEAVTSTERNVLATDEFVGLGRRSETDAAWGNQTDDRSGTVVLRTANRWEAARLSVRVYGADNDRYVNVSYSSDGESWTTAIVHDEGGWQTYEVELADIQATDETIYIRLEGGSTTSSGGGLIDHLSLEPRDMEELALDTE